MRNRFLQLHPSDNVAVGLTDLAEAERVEVSGQSFVLKETIPAKHKFFIQNMEAGQPVTMYGATVGVLKCSVQQGQRLAEDNTLHATTPFNYRQIPHHWQAPDISRFQHKTFKGYHRSDGRVGTANYWLFIPTVFCENRNLDVIREALHNELGYAVTDQYKTYTRQLADAYRRGEDLHQIQLNPDLSQQPSQRLFPNIDGIKFLNHQGGCGGTRQDATTLCHLLAAYADHPNVAGITLLSLGCQHLEVKDFTETLKQRNPHFDKPLLVFEQQSAQSGEDLIRSAISQTFLQLAEANKAERRAAPLSQLCIGVKCGGSDGFSGISANPAVGHCADLLVGLGGKILLAEFPELCGAEQELIDRAVDEPTAMKFIRLMEEYDALAHAVGSGFHMNPSPGNIRDGIITDAMKSIGACKKGGTSPVVDVLDYTQPALKPGLSLVCTPGNDVESTTGKVASGATLILFTTGLGTPTGNPICPVIKVSSNKTVAQRMSDIIDIDTGGIIEGEISIEAMGEAILDYVIRAASGEVIPKAVLLNQDDFIPWKRGVSL